MAEKLKKCAIISGAPESDFSYYDQYLEGRYIICADSGYKKCSAAGIVPDLIIGDFDSSDKPKTNVPVICLKVRKDDTDTFYCVKKAISDGYNDIVILGGIGSRVDHTYSNILSLVYCFDRNIKCELVNNNNRVFVGSGEIRLKKGEFRYFSVFALFDKCEGLTIKGAQYDIADFDLEPDCQMTQSNGFRDCDVDISLKKGKILIILCND